MFSLVGMLFLFRFGSIPPHDDGLPISFRAEAHEIAIRKTARWSPALPVATATASTGSELDLPLLFGAGPALGPIRPAYHPQDWVSAVAHKLDVADHPLGRMAIWLSEIPVQLDARPPSRVYVRLTLRGL